MSNIPSKRLSIAVWIDVHGKVRKISEANHIIERTLLYEEWENLRDAVEQYYSGVDPQMLRQWCEADLQERSAHDEAWTRCKGAQQKQKNGYIYVLRSGPHYKIGKTKRLQQRVSQLQVTMPLETELVHTIETPDPTGDEAYLHEKFASKRCNGEWFELDEEDVAWLKTQ